MPDTTRATKWVIFLGATALVLYLCLLILRPFANVIAWSAVLAIAFYPVHRYLVRATGRVALSALLCSALVVGLVVVPLMFIIGVALNQLIALRGYLQQAPPTALLAKVSEWIGRLGIDVAAVIAWLRQHATDFAGATAGLSLALAANVTGVIVSFVFTIFALFLLFRDGDRIVTRITELLPFDRARNEAMLLHIRDVVYASVYGVVVIALVQGVLCGLMFWLLGIPSAALWGTLTVVTSVIPLVGAAGVWVPGALYLVAIGRWPQAIVLAVWGGLVISSVDNFLRPKLVGGRIGLSELVIFFALLGGLQVFGVLGIVLGPAVFAVAASVLDVLSPRNSRS